MHSPLTECLLCYPPSISPPAIPPPVPTFRLPPQGGVSLHAALPYSLLSFAGLLSRSDSLVMLQSRPHVQRLDILSPTNSVSALLHADSVPVTPGARMPLYAYAKRPCTNLELDGVPGCFQPGFLDSGSRRSESTSSFASYDDLLSFRESLSSSSDDDSLSSSGASDIHDDDQDTPAFSLRKHITSEWDRKFQEGLFRYDVTACQSKVIEGRLGFIAQLNEGRHSKKRPSEFPMDKVLQPFDPSKFNFTKVGQNEMLFRFEEGGEEESLFHKEAVVEESPSIVAINVSPIDYGHVLLVPRVLDRIPQRIDEPSLLMALRLASEVNDPAFRIGYNSLGAFATINHLHFQAYFLDLPFAIERASSKEIAVSTNGCKVEELTDYPVKTLVFQVGACLEQMTSAAAAACCELQERNIPFNLFIVDRGTRLFLIPQLFKAGLILPLPPPFPFAEICREADKGRD
ncbi:unnamed protein product [Closterium sp. Naga37s-1]|nr:unnamed protein product [Closterium sp. Naga37s-1]